MLDILLYLQLSKYIFFHMQSIPEHDNQKQKTIAFSHFKIMPAIDIAASRALIRLILTIQVVCCKLYALSVCTLSCLFVILFHT